MAIVEYKITVAMTQGCVNAAAVPFIVKVFNAFIALILPFMNCFCNHLAQALSDFVTTMGQGSNSHKTR